MTKENRPSSSASTNFLNVKKKEESELLACLPKSYELERDTELLDWEDRGVDYFDFKGQESGNKVTYIDDDNDNEYAASFKSMLIKESAIARLKSHTSHLQSNPKMANKHAST